MDASSSRTGFFQDSPSLPNQFVDDVAFRRALELFVPLRIQSSINQDLERFGQKVLSPQVLRWLADAERNPPSLQTWTTFGRRKDELVTSEGWRELQKLGIREGVVAIAYEKKFARFDRIYQFLKLHLWTPSNAYVSCPSAMQDGAAALLSRHINLELGNSRQTRQVIVSAFTRLTSRDPDHAWTSGQWMTERSGGSDVRGTETRAVLLPPGLRESKARSSDGHALGPWSVSGFKWFSSATDANMTVLLAKTDKSDRVSTFFAPMQRTTADVDSTATEFNGVRIQRLKSKLGTRALPTAELELEGMRAYLLGVEGEGTKEISSVLNITRLYTAVAAVGSWGRGLAISRAFARVRRTSGRLLMDVPAHVKGLARQHVLYRAHMLMTYFVVALLGIEETRVDDAYENLPLLPGLAQAGHLLRLLTPVSKAMTSLAAVASLRFCMESLGGIGYLENDEPELNLARIFRDTNVLCIWEGTTDVLASDTVRVLTGRQGASVMGSFTSWARQALLRYRDHKRSGALPLHRVESEVASFERTMRSGKAESLLYNGRALMNQIAFIVASILLIEDALRDCDEVALVAAQRFAATRSDIAFTDEAFSENWVDEARLDRKICFDKPLNPGQASRL